MHCAGAGILVALFGLESGLGANSIGLNVTLNVWQALLAEVLLTYAFVLAIIGVTSKSENSIVAGLVIGLTLTLVHIMGLPLTGTSVNPARSLAPALLVGGEALKQVWVFIVAPLIGSALAAFSYKCLSEK